MFCVMTVHWVEEWYQIIARAILMYPGVAMCRPTRIGNLVPVRLMKANGTRFYEKERYDIEMFLKGIICSQGGAWAHSELIVTD